ncbi:GNAT family N-acetyltransferase [bacterium]|nr:GNAT family N-acetyltransferase [bacterium]
MTTHYYKRYRMECDLTQGAISIPALPEDYVWQNWRAGCEDRHAWVKLQSFREEVDATVFECLGDYQGCLHLMRDIAGQDGFLSDATWLISLFNPADGKREDCGTIQAVALTETLASIQNVGVTPMHRGLGLGRALVSRCLAECQAAGLHRIGLEVTAGNLAAVHLYRTLGFKVTRTMYRTVDVSAWLV